MRAYSTYAFVIFVASASGPGTLTVANAQEGGATGSSAPKGKDSPKENGGPARAAPAEAGITPSKPPGRKEGAPPASSAPSTSGDASRAGEESPSTTPSSDVNEGDRHRAAVLHAAGQAKMRQGDFKGAQDAFEEAYLRAPNPVVLLAIADAREQLGDGPGAVEALERYLKERADAPDAEAVRARAEALRARPAKVKLATSPAGASIRVDGEALALKTPAEITLPAGKHTLELSLPGHAPLEEAIEVPFGGRVSLMRRFVADASSPAFGDGEPLKAPEPAVVAKKEALGAPKPAVWIASGVALAGGIAGTVLGFLALSDEAAFNENPTTRLANRGERLALFADVSFGLALAATATAVVLYVTQDEKSDTKEAGLRWVPVAHPALAGLVVEGAL